MCNEGDRSINCLTSSIMLSMRFGGENCHCVHYTHHRASKKINNNTKSGLYYIPFCFFAFLFFLFHLISMSYIPEQMPASCSFLFLPPHPPYRPHRDGANWRGTMASRHYREECQAELNPFKQITHRGNFISLAAGSDGKYTYKLGRV